MGLQIAKLRYVKRAFSNILVILFMVTAFSFVATATEVIVNKSVPSAKYSVGDIRAIFIMQKRLWPDNRQIKVYTLPDSNPLHKEFVKSNLHMLPHQIRRIWDRMTYSGTGNAPIQLDSEQEMIDKIANTPGSIGYLSITPNNENIRAFTSH